jgi:hypothetical protein
MSNDATVVIYHHQELGGRRKQGRHIHFHSGKRHQEMLPPYCQSCQVAKSPYYNLHNSPFS